MKKWYLKPLVDEYLSMLMLRQKYREKIQEATLFMMHSIMDE